MSECQSHSAAEDVLLARDLFAAGEFAEAERLCRLVLHEYPREAAALHLRGLIGLHENRLDEASFLLSAAIGAEPGNAAALNDLGAVLQARGRHEEALPHHQQAIALRPDYAPAHFNLGNGLHALGRNEEAIAAYRAAITLRPDYAEAQNNLGNAQQAIGYLGEAAGSYRRAIALRPTLAEAYGNLGKVLHELELFAEAADSYRRALAIRPENPETLNNLGNVLLELNRGEEAVACFKQAIAQRPDLVAAHYNLANACFAAGRLEDAIASYRRALALKPEYADAETNLGNALMGINRIEEALGCYRRAAIFSANSTDARFGQALALLALGALREGWAAYEARRQIREITPMADRYAFRPAWRGEPGVAGKRILLHGEQGFGDAIQFARYAPLVAARGATVFVEVRPELRRLMQSLGGVDLVIPLGESLPDFDLQCPVMSLPLAFRTDLTSIPARIPYLRPPADCAAAWRKRLGSAGGARRIGIAWSGNPQFRNDRNRSLPAEALAPLLASPESQFHLLQKDIRGADLAALRQAGDVADHRAALTDFAETAALISLLNLVITVDTAVAHLAGALGVRTWVLLPYAADWRWLRESERSPWYPTVRLFRQTSPGDWDEVITRVTAALTGLRWPFPRAGDAPRS